METEHYITAMGIMASGYAEYACRCGELIDSIDAWNAHKLGLTEV